MARQKLAITGPFKGLVTKKDSTLLDISEASDALNLILDEGGMRQRTGTELFGSISTSGMSNSDNFNRANSASLGGIWTEFETGGTFEILSNAVLMDATGATFDCVALTSAVTNGENIVITVDLTPENELQPSIISGVVGRATDENNFYWFRMNAGTGSTLQIGKRVGGTDEVLASGKLDVAITIGGTFAMTFIIQQIDNVNAMLVGYVTGGGGSGDTFDDDVVAVIDDSITSGTLCGMFGIDNPTAGTNLNTTFDNWTATSDTSIRGITSYIDTSGELFTIGKFQTGLYKLTDGGATAIAATGLTAGTPIAFALANNRIYMGDGTADGKVTDGATIENVQIINPAAAPTVATTTGVQTGDYDYRYTGFSTAWGIESPASPKSALITVAAQGVTVTMVDQSGVDSRVDKHRVYRRKVSRGDTKWRLVAEINAGTTYTDNNPDNDVDDNAFAPVESDATLPAFQYLTQFADRMFWAGGANKTTLYFSEAGRPGAVLDETNNSLLIGGDDDTDPITGLEVIHNFLVIFKRLSIHILTGDAPDNFQREKVIDGIGCVSNGSIVSAENWIYFSSERGLYRFNGSNMQLLSNNVETTWNARLSIADPFIVSTHDIDNGAIWWSYWGASATNNNTVLVYYYRHSEQVGSHSWMLWDFANGPTALARTFNLSTKDDEIHLGQTNGKSAVFDITVRSDSATSGNGTAIESSWTTGKIDVGATDGEKNWLEFTLDGVNGSANGSAVSMRYFLDNGSSVTATNSVDFTSGTIGRNLLARMSRYIRLKWFNNTLNHTPNILGFTMDYEVQGRGFD